MLNPSNYKGLPRADLFYAVNKRSPYETSMSTLSVVRCLYDDL